MDNPDETKHDPIKTTKKYSAKKVSVIRWIYILSILLWLFLAWYLELYKTYGIGYIILGIPIFFYLIGLYNADKLTVEVEEKTCAVSYISISLLIVIPLVAWVDKNYSGNQWYMSKIIVVAVVLALISLIDIWVRPKWISAVRHIKSTLQTASLSLLVFALFTYYTGQHQIGAAYSH